MRKAVLTWLFCVLLTPLLGQAAAPEEDPWVMLEKAGQAARKLSYKGIFVYQSGHAVSNLQITHMNCAQGEFARVMSLDGAPREILQQGNEAVIYSPQHEKIMIEKRRVQNSFPALLPGLTDALKASYRAHVTGQERIGGRDGVVIQLVPRDQYRYGYRFYLDRESGLLLKSVMVNENNEAIEQVAFSQLALMPMTRMDWFHPNIERGKDYEMQQEENVMPARAEGGEWKVAHLPSGFVEVDQLTRSMPGKTQPVEQMIFSDGIASVSLFIEKLDKGVQPQSGHLLQGATHIYANTVEGHQVVVVGEVPELVVRQIGDSVSFRK
jgi:sigma-E factor negative regulatory protein RseB